MPKATLEEVLRFGALMLRSGHAAFRVRQSMGAIASSMGLDHLSVKLGLRSIIATGRRGTGTATLVREVGAPTVNTERIAALDALARTIPPGVSASEFAMKLTAIETAPPRYSIVQTAVAVGVACGAFASLNGGVGPEVAACAVGGGVGQGLRSLLLRLRFNQFAVTAMCAVIASAVYCLVSSAAVHAGFGAVRNSAGLISSVLFLVPGFPMVAAMLDLLQHETGAALSRLAYATTLLLAAAFGLSLVIYVVGFAIERSPPPVFPMPQTLALRAVASFAGACGFAILYNGAWRNVLLVGVIASMGNEIRLALHDVGLALPPATFFGALAVGLMASLVARWVTSVRIVLTVPGVIMMVPGIYAFETLVYFNRGEVLAGLSAAVVVGFVTGAMATGLAAARFLTQRESLRE
ncbi:MAG TPA: threonine/serine exporter family protein [Steroidobacteraceae bacterium]|nr:threonine/serine exporter family protein [Steroidobacteraceae bacterium]